MIRLVIVFLIVGTVLPVFALEAPQTEQQKTLYTIGQTVSQQLAVFNLSSDEFAYVLMGLQDAQAGKEAAVDSDAYAVKVQELARERRKAYGSRLVPLGNAALLKAAGAPGAIKTASGLVYQPLRNGDGPSPGQGDTIRVQYRGFLPDGKEFDSSYKRGTPLELTLSKAIKCWSEGLQKMQVGGKARLTCPASLGYGEYGAGSLIPPQATLLFDVELLAIMKK